MNFNLMLTHAAGEIVACNRFTEQYGLTLTHAQAIELAETRNIALSDTKRVELGGGIVTKIIMAFADSPFLSKYNYAETLNELTEIFYHFKNETMDAVPDDELVKFMKDAFDGVCAGSIELLAGRELYRYAKNARYGLPLDFNEDEGC